MTDVFSSGYDLCPNFPVLNKFLNFWLEKLEGPLHSLCNGGARAPNQAHRDPRHRRRVPPGLIFAGRLQRVQRQANGDRPLTAADFAICPDCGGTMRRIAAVPRPVNPNPSVVARHILALSVQKVV